MRLASLSKKADFTSLFKHGRKFFKEHIMAKALLLPSVQSNCVLRIAYTTPKKKFPKAVMRNLIKRKLRAAILQSLSDVTIDASSLKQIILCNIFPSSKVTRMTFKQLYEEVRSMLTQILVHYAKSSKDSQ
jgi:ribonuclease P protein component